MMPEPELVTNRPIIVRPGTPGYVESNATNAYLGEWIVFAVPFGDTVAEIRFPIEEAIDSGLIIALNEEEVLGNDY